MSILSVLEQQLEELRARVEETARRLAGEPGLDVLHEAETRFQAEEADARRRLEHARRELAATRDRIVARQDAEAEHQADAALLAAVADLLDRHRRTVERPSAADAIAATGLPVRPTAPAEPQPAPDDDLSFNVTQASPETVAATTEGTPIITDPEHLAGGSPIVTATDPVTPSTGEPRHAKPKGARTTGPLRALGLIHRDKPTDETGDV